MKKRIKKLRGKIMINSREWNLVGVNKECGGWFRCSDESGVGYIRIGVKKATRRAILEVLVHEIIEGILADDGIRWKESNEKMLFAFDHNYLENFGPKVVEALVSCGAMDPNIKVL